MLRESRSEERRLISHIAMVTVYPDTDEEDRSYEEAVSLMRNNKLFSVFNVFSLVEDISEHGMGLRFRGQSLVANNILKVRAPHMLKLTLSPFTAIEPSLAPFIFSEHDTRAMMLRARCRWHELPRQRGQSRMGFQIRENNPAPLLDFGHHGLFGMMC